MINIEEMEDNKSKGTDDYMYGQNLNNLDSRPRFDF